MDTMRASKKPLRGTVAIGVAGAGEPQSMFEVAAGRSIRVEIPESFAAEHVALAARDSELLTGIFKKHSHDLCQIVYAVNEGKFTEAKKMAEKIGLAEESFVRQGGGLWGLIIVLGIGAALLLEHD